MMYKDKVTRSNDIKKRLIEFLNNESVLLTDSDVVFPRQEELDDGKIDIPAPMDSRIFKIRLNGEYDR